MDFPSEDALRAAGYVEVDLDAVPDFVPVDLQIAGLFSSTVGLPPTDLADDA